MFKTPKSEIDSLHHWLPPTPSKPRLSDNNAFLFNENEIFFDKSFSLPNLEPTSLDSPRKINLRPGKDFKRWINLRPSNERTLRDARSKDLKQ